MHNEPFIANPNTLEIVHRHRCTDTVFRQFDARAGVCVCCRALFEPMTEMARRYHLDLSEMIAALEEAIRRQPKQD